MALRKKVPCCGLMPINYDYSLKSLFVFSHPADDASKAATLSVSLIFMFLCLSVHSSYMVDKLNNSVCDDRPDSTSSSKIARP